MKLTVSNTDNQAYFLQVLNLSKYCILNVPNSHHVLHKQT